MLRAGLWRDCKTNPRRDRNERPSRAKLAREHIAKTGDCRKSARSGFSAVMAIGHLERFGNGTRTRDCFGR